MAASVDRRSVDAAAPSIRPTIGHAGRVVATAGALGLVGQLLFFDVGLGVNFPIAIALLVGSGWILRRRRAAPPLLDAWLGPAALAFAAFAAIRADPFIVGLDVLVSLALSGGALASFAGRPVISRSLGGIIELAVRAVGWALGGALPALAAATRQAEPRASLHRAAPAVAVVRGLLIAVPIVAIFVILFASADAVFARLVDNVLGTEIDLGSGMWRGVLAAALAWLAAGGLALSAALPPVEQPAAEPSASRRLGATELMTVVVAVVAVFCVFVALQAAYLFGGLDTLAVSGVSYAEYARRGFFELVAVAFLAGGLAIAADRLAPRSRHLMAATIGLLVLTAVVLVSATLRMRLYQEAYGWTELRLYVLATIVLLGVGVVGLVATIVLDRVRLIGHLLIGAALVIGLLLNAMGPIRFISEQNVAPALDPSLVPTNGATGLDTSYVASLGDDAVPALVRAIPALDQDAAQDLRLILRTRLDQLRDEPGLNAWQAWNAGRSAARDALEAAYSALVLDGR